MYASDTLKEDLNPSPISQRRTNTKNTSSSKDLARAVSSPINDLVKNAPQVKRLQKKQDHIHQLQQKYKPTPLAPLKEVVTDTAKAPIQRVSIGRIYKTSQNDNYRTKIADSNYLGVKKGAPAPQPASLITSTGKETSKFKEYKFSGSVFENDCLQFAQRLTNTIAGKPLTINSQIALSDGTVTGIQFAVPHAPVPGTFTSNQAAKGAFDQPTAKFGQNGGANPTVGQSYAIIPKENDPLKECLFHIAAVVAKDGRDNITCEADAGTARTEPVFDMYSTDQTTGFTFHARYQATYRGAPGSVAVTGVIRPPI